jgi:hypothetical protein
MLLPGKSTSPSPHASPPRERRSPSPLARSQLSPEPSRGFDNQPGDTHAQSYAAGRATAAAAAAMDALSALRGRGDHQRVAEEAANDGSMSARGRLAAIEEEARAAGSRRASATGAGSICPNDTKRALDWLEQHFGSSTGASSLAMETEQIVAALRGMLGAAAAAADEPFGQRHTSTGTAPMRSSISFAEDVELAQQRAQRQRQLQQLEESLGCPPRALQEHSTAQGGSSSTSSSPAAYSPAPGQQQDFKSPKCLTYGHGHRAHSPMGFVYRPKQSAGELQQQRPSPQQQQQQRQPPSQQQQQQQSRRRSSDHMRLSSSWDSSPVGAGSWGAPSPRGAHNNSNSSSMGAIKAGRSGKLGSSGPVKPSVASGMGLIAGGGYGVLLADDPAFQEACKVGAAACFRV